MSETLTVSVRLKVKTLASLTYFMHKQGFLPANRGQVISSVLDLKFNEIVEGFGNPFKSDVEALDFLDSIGFIGSAKVNSRKIFKIKSKHSQTVASLESNSVGRMLEPVRPEFNQLNLFRDVVLNLWKMGEPISDENLEQSQMVLDSSGKPIPVENYVKPTEEQQKTFPSGKTDGLAGMLPEK